MKFKLIYLSLAAALLTSCNLDRQPLEQVVTDELLSNPNSIITVTNGNYALLKGDANGSGFYNNLYRSAEYGGENVSLSGTTTDPLFFMYNYKSIKTNSRASSIWSNGYRAIIGCNKVINTAQEGKDAGTDQLIGENYFLRAYVYFQLVNTFGRPYYQGRQNLGVPVKTSTDVNDLPPRATVGEVYDRVVEDLKKAETLMTDSDSRVRATKLAAQALLSRVYLYMGDNQKAADYATTVINSGKRSLVSTAELPDYVKKEPESNSETIFAFKYNRDGDYTNGWGTIGSMFANIDNVGWGEMYASSTYLDLLDENPNDVRAKFIAPVYLKDASGQRYPAVYWVDADYKYQFRRITTDAAGNSFFTEGTSQVPVLSTTENGRVRYYFTDSSGKTIFVKKDYDMDKRNGFPKFYILKASLQQNIPQLYSPIILRLAEMYLNRAEANAKMGKTVEALADVNIIRKRAGIPVYTEVPAGMTLLAAVLKERRLELAYEAHAKFDVFRNGLTLNRRYPGTHLSGNNPFYEVAATNNRVVEYIPEEQIIAQPNLQQNPD